MKIKKLFVIAGCVTFSVSVFLMVGWEALGDTTLLWNFGTGTAVATPSSTTGDTPEWATPSFTIGNTLGTVTTPISTTSPSGVYTGASGSDNLGNASKTGAFVEATSSYFDVIFTPVSGFKLTITNFDFGSRSTGTGAQGYALYSSVDGFTNPLMSGSLAATSAWAFHTNTAFTLNGADNTPIELRLYTFNGTGNASSGTINTRIDDVSIKLSSTTSSFVPANDFWAVTDGTGNWDTSTPNWTGGQPVANQYVEGDAVHFDDSHPGVPGGVVTVTATGVAPGSVVVNTGATYTISGGPIGGIGSITNSGSGTLILGSSNSYSGGTNLNAGIVAFSDDTNLGTGNVVFNSGTLRTLSSGTVSRPLTVTAGLGGAIDTNGFSPTFASAVAGTGILTKTGLGTLTFSAPIIANLAIASGTIALTSGSTTNITAGGPFNGTLLLAALSRLNLTGTVAGSGSIDVAANAAAINGSALGVLISTNVNLNTLGAPTFLTNIGAGGSTSLIINGTITGNSDVNFAAGTPSVNFPIVNGGAGTTILNATNTYTGRTIMNFTSVNGILRLGIDNALPQTTDFSFATSSIATFDMAGHNQTVASIAATAAVTSATTERITTLSAGTSTLTVNGTANTTFNGIIYDNGTTNKVAFVKDGFGTLTLGGTSYYTGGTTIKNGNLVVNNILGAATNPGQVTITTGTLSGAGAIRGSIVASPGGEVMPTQLLTIQTGLDLSGGGAYRWKILSSFDDTTGGVGGTDFTQLVLSGLVAPATLTLGGSAKLTLDFTSFTDDPNSADDFWLTQSHTWTIISSVSGSATGQFTITNPTYTDGVFAAFTDPSTGTTTLTYTAIPEPGACVLVLGGLGALAGMCRRKRTA